MVLIAYTARYLAAGTSAYIIAPL